MQQVLMANIDFVVEPEKSLALLDMFVHKLLEQSFISHTIATNACVIFVS